jgi:hypothetical protein
VKECPQKKEGCHQDDREQIVIRSSHTALFGERVNIHQITIRNQSLNERFTKKEFNHEMARSILTVYSAILTCLGGGAEGSKVKGVR